MGTVIDCYQFHQLDNNNQLDIDGSSKKKIEHQSTDKLVEK